MKPIDASVQVYQQHPERTLSQDYIRQLVSAIIADENAHVREISVVLADHATVRQLNTRYLEHDCNTDVLAFPLSDSESEPVEGEVYIDLDTAAERCGEFEASFEEEAARYVIHGTLHLLGYTDKNEDGTRIMREKEESYLAAHPPKST